MTGTATLTLAEFWEARIAEDEAVASAASFQQGDWADYIATYLPSFGEMHLQALRWSPARVLAECVAERRIAHEHTRRDDGSCYNCETGQCRLLQLLALPYADHPDFREEWRL